jgi:ergothioneine biosynthesis protein EgtB
MRVPETRARPATSRSPLLERYRRIRGATGDLCRPLAVEDQVVQSMPDASPTKWHLAHTTWFFEEFVLRAADPATPPWNEAFRTLFNSYYNSVGAFHPRAARGVLSRPTVAEVLEYRARVDARMEAALAAGALPDGVADIVLLGFAHEEQHQELLLTDILHAFSCNPLRPAYAPPVDGAGCAGTDRARIGHAPTSRSGEFARFDGGIARVGHAGTGFAFDNEGPAHDVLLQPFALALRPTTNAEYRAFVQAGGYRDPSSWLSDGWALVEREGWRHPLYWSDGLHSQFSLHGEVDLVESDPVCHLSYFEADAFARWAGARLPTEHEWETAARDTPAAGNFQESGRLLPAAAPHEATKPAQLFGDVWEWTRSPYVPYPGFRAENDGLGEYNGKFMVQQLVLRGGSALTPQAHVRATYRNFFPPAARWQMSGIRLAQDL